MNPGDGHFEVVVRVTIAFLDANLKAHPEAMFFAGLYVGDNPSLAALE